MKKRTLVLLTWAFLLVCVLGASAWAQERPESESALVQRMDDLETRIGILERQLLCLQSQLDDPDSADCDLETIRTETPAVVSAPPPSSAATDIPEPPAEGYPDGTYLVGSDIAPGLYRSSGGEFCIWERLSGLSGEFDDIIAAGYEEGSAVVEIREGDMAFKSTGCGAWTLADSVSASEALESEAGEYPDGTYLVGSDMAPGLYRSPGGAFCIWERLSGLSGEFDDIIAGGYEEGSAVVEIQEGDVAFKSVGCGTWTPVDPSSTPAPHTLELAAEGYPNGTYLVGWDMAPGLYRSPGGEFCIWERLSGLSGEFDDIIAGGYEEGSAVVEIREGDVAFKSVGCGAWVPVE